MGGHARDIGGRVYPLAISLLMGACGGWGDDLLTVQHLPLSSPVEADATFYVESADRFLIGQAGQLLRVHDGGAPTNFPTGGIATPRVIAVLEDGIIVHSGDRLLRLSPEGEVESSRDDMEPSLLEMDPRGRWILQAARSGAVFGHSPATLIPRWGWASLGERTTGLAVAPEGGSLFQAVAGEILLRDLQTGRIVERMEVSAPFHQLVGAGGGRVYGVAGSDGRATVFAIHMGGEESRIVWRRTLDDLGLGDGAQVRLSPSGAVLIVFGTGKESGLRMLNAETGDAEGSIMEGPLDAGFGSNGELFLLYPGEIRALR